MKVVFVQKFVPHYRLPFFEQVREELIRRGIDFELVYGQPDLFEGSKVRMVYPVWGKRVNNRIFCIAGKYVYWQRANRFVAAGDLVVAEHAAKLIDNYLFYLRCMLGQIRFGYFGHGQNFQARHELALSSWLKRLMLRRVSRWFAYTEVSRQSLLRQGVDERLITVVNNTLTTPQSPASRPSRNPHRFLYIGGLYADKRLDLILAAAEGAAQVLDNFELHIVGDGPSKPIVLGAAERLPWLTYHGSLYGLERDELLCSSSAIVMPGLVGLVAVDSFHFGCPILTASAGQHSPEVAYLESEVNCLFDHGSGTAETFTELIVRFATEPGLADHLRQGCAVSAKIYTLENMVTRFCDGAELCLRQA